MDDQIICPNCKKPIPLTQALSAKIQERYQIFYRKRLFEEKAKLEQTLREQLAKQLKTEVDFQLKNKTNEVEELQKQNRSLQEQLLELNKLIRQLKVENDQKRLELEKRLIREQEKIREEEKKRFEDEYKLKLLEKDKKLEDALKLVSDYKRKLEQGSEQLQGEILELELESLLKKEFPLDEIKPVPKGVRGADVLQVVKNNFGRVCGTIIWESKRTKAWNNEWITKLKEDQRQVKAEIGVIISQVLPNGIKRIGLENDIWIGDFDSIIILSLMLRETLQEISKIKLANTNRQSKMEILYNYFSGVEFKQRIEAIVESFTSAQEDLEKEKRYFLAKWSKQEKNIRKVFDNLAGMYGDLQSMMGRALPEVEGFEMLPSANKKKVDETLF